MITQNDPQDPRPPPHLNHIPILRRNIHRIRPVRLPSRIRTPPTHHHRPKPRLHRIQRRDTHTPARQESRYHDGIHAHCRQLRREVRPEEGGGVFLVQSEVVWLGEEGGVFPCGRGWENSEEEWKSLATEGESLSAGRPASERRGGCRAFGRR